MGHINQKQMSLVTQRCCQECNEKSVGQSEFYQSASVGLKPEIKLEAKLIDLTNVTHIKYNGIIYKILRTYKKEDIVELILTSTIIENKYDETSSGQS